MESRPKLTIKFSTFDWMVEALCLLLLVTLWIGVVIVYPILPESIPRHFNAAGKPDGYSGKSAIFILPFVSVITYTMLTVLNRYPHIFNYLSKVTDDNAREMYTSATRMIRLLKLAVLIIFSAIIYLTCRTVLTNNTGLGNWFLPASIGVLMLPLVYYLINAARPRKPKALGA